jgi:hypothetical protein
MIRFQVGQTPHGEVQDILNLPPGAGETFEIGTVLSRVGATVVPYVALTGIYGVAQSPARDGVAIVVGGNANGVNVARPHGVKFIGQMWDSGQAAGEELVTLTEADHLGNQYGIILVDQGGPNGSEQFIDFTNTLTPVLEIVDIKTELNIAVFKFLSAEFQEEV